MPPPCRQWNAAASLLRSQKNIGDRSILSGGGKRQRDELRIGARCSQHHGTVRRQQKM